MLQTLKKAWGLPEIRHKLLVVLFILAIYRIGAVIPVPFVIPDTFGQHFGDTIFSYMSILSGGALEQASLFALGVSPYITASIVLQLLTVAFPKLGERAKQGEEGKQFINKWTRIVTVILAVVTAIGYYILLSNNGMLVKEATIGAGNGLWLLYAAGIVVCFCAGAALVMWLAEKINENGLGNGISLILFFNIICSLPNTVQSLVEIIRVGFYEGAGNGIGAIGLALFVVLGLLAMTFFIIFITGSERRIPVQYAKRVVGRKMYGGQSTNLPLQLNMSGVMPVIFASSIVSLPATIMVLCGVSNSTEGFWGVVYKIFDANGWVYPILLFVLIIAFSYFYITISFNPIEVANNLKKNGGMIPGIRQGKPTADYITRILGKITLMGALFLSVIAILPIAVRPLIEVIIGAIAPGTSTLTQLAANFTFGGTSILIVVGIALETYREIEAQLTMRNYKGFLS